MADTATGNRHDRQWQAIDDCRLLKGMGIIMKVLIVGSGGREHAIATSVAKSPKVCAVRWIYPEEICGELPEGTGRTRNRLLDQPE